MTKTTSSSSFYENKERYLASQGFEKVDFREFYRDIFPVGSLESEVGKQEIYDKTNKGNVFLVYSDDNKKFKTRFVFDDLSEIERFLEYKTVFLSPISYFGRNRTSANAREMFALAMDLDDVDTEQIDLIFGWKLYHDRMPLPTYIVNSGGGVHLYWVFDRPIPMYPNIQRELKRLKYALVDRIWDEDTSQLRQKQYQGINQGFRLVGGKTKNGEVVTAWKTGEKVDLAYLSRFVPPDCRILDTFYHPKMTLDEAKKKFPKWYEQRIEGKMQRKAWKVKRALYDWWKNQVDGVVYHHRYFYTMCLAVYAVKCGVPFDELKKDAFSFQDYLTHKSPGNPFTADDINSALEMYQECYRTFPRSDIAKLSGIKIPPNKRNGRTRAEHVKLMNFVRDELNKNTNWRDGNGRKSVESVVFDFLSRFPDAKADDFVKETGLSRRVFFKYKKGWKDERDREEFNAVWRAIFPKKA